MRVLIVDDDRVLTLLTRRLLEEEGFAVDVADTRSSAQTLAMVHEYDGIVLDLGLPDGNGVALIQELRRRNRTTPILVLSGATDADPRSWNGIRPDHVLTELGELLSPGLEGAPPRGSAVSSVQRKVGL